MGIQVDTHGVGSSKCAVITPEEEDLFRRMAGTSNIHEKIANSIAPSIYGSVDIKKAIACLLMGGIYFV